jgi:ribosomal protein L11 methylase PrmA
VRHGGSFRDPDARLFEVDGRLVRLLRGEAAAGLRQAQDRGLLARWLERGHILPLEPLDPAQYSELGFAAELGIEHARLSFVSYPYEWSFGGLAAAALLHLRLQLEALEAGLVFRDASAYNIAFEGAQPRFIDLGSLRPYRPNEFWVGHEQFCRQFLNPLLLQRFVGVPFQPWYRGEPLGLASRSLQSLLPWRAKLRPRVFSHVLLPELLMRRNGQRAQRVASDKVRSGGFSLRAYRATLEQLHDWIASLRPSPGSSSWSEYDLNCGYTEGDRAAKERFVARWIEVHRPPLLLDVGCNRGRFAELALHAGAGRVIGIESDAAAVDLAFERAAARATNFLPLAIDFVDASPDQGWRERERMSFRRRGRFDAVMALAVIHHFALTRGVPLHEVVEDLVALAPCGLIEFVPADDAMVQHLIALRTGAAPEYGWQPFSAALTGVTEIEETAVLPDSKRVLVAFRRRLP